jgi:hypothetical protein
MELIEKLKAIPQIKEGDDRLRLGVLRQPPLVACRLISEDLFQEAIALLEKPSEWVKVEDRLPELLFDLCLHKKPKYCFVTAFVKIENNSITKVDWVIQKLGNLEEEQIIIDLQEFEFDFVVDEDAYYDLNGLFLIEYDSDDYRSWQYLTDIVKVEFTYQATIKEVEAPISDTKIDFPFDL